MPEFYKDSCSTSCAVTLIHLLLPWLCLQLKEEFAFTAADSKSLMAEFQPLKSKVLKVAESYPAAASILAVLNNESDEGNFIGLCL